MRSSSFARPMLVAWAMVVGIVAGAIPAFAQEEYPTGQELQNYFSNASTTGGQAYVNIIASLEGNTTGTSAAAREGETCAMIYVFNTEQSLQACCGCPVTADGLLTLNITTQLAGNPVALGKLLQDGVIRIIPTLPNAVPPGHGITQPAYEGCDANTGVCCDPTAAPAVTDPTDGTVSSNQLVAWADHIQNTQITETPFDSETVLEVGAEPEEEYDAYGLPGACGAIIKLGSLQGACTCPTGPVGFTPTAKPRR